MEIMEYPLSATVVLGQQPAPNFQPGAWKINSVTTMTDGKTVSSLTDICANVQADFWKRKQAGLECDPPKVIPAEGGIRVRVVCIYNPDMLNSRIESDVIEKFSDDGTSFTAAGTSKTNTVYDGHAPEVTSAQLQAKAHRVGPCK